MNPKIKLAWIRALRSGKYRRGEGMLRENTPRGPKFCCLGVLCDLYAKATKTPWDSDQSILGCGAFLPQKVADWAGVEDRSVVIAGSSAAHLNDSGRSFKGIATLIEKHL